MQYYIKQQIFSWNDRFTVKDRFGNDIYFVEGAFFSWGKKLSMSDSFGNEVLYIKQNIWNFRPNYSIQGPNWDVDGSVWAHDYQILNNNELIATVSKEWFTWGDSYSLDIHDENHSLLALGIIIVIDCVMATQQSSSTQYFL